MRTRSVLSARHFNADTTTSPEVIGSPVEEGATDAKSTRVGINDKGSDPAQLTRNVKKLVSMSAQATDYSFTIDRKKHCFVGGARQRGKLVGNQVGPCFVTKLGYQIDNFRGVRDQGISNEHIVDDSSEGGFFQSARARLGGELSSRIFEKINISFEIKMTTVLITRGNQCSLMEPPRSALSPPAGSPDTPRIHSDRAPPGRFPPTTPIGLPQPRASRETPLRPNARKAPPRFQLFPIFVDSLLLS